MRYTEDVEKLKIAKAHGRGPETGVVALVLHLDLN